MECRTCSESLSALLDGEVSHAEAEPLESHLHECTRCFQEYESLLYSYDLVDRLTTTLTDPRPALWESIHSEIAPRQTGRHDSWLPFKIHWLPLAGALGIISLGAISASLFFVETPNSELKHSFQRYLQERESRQEEAMQSASRNPFRTHEHDLEGNPFRSE